jgi:ParB-like chromosome segregation protein Spo0J
MGPKGPVILVKTSELKPSEFCKGIYDLTPKEDFVESIGANGVLVPLWVTVDNKIIGGHRRWAAAMKLNLDTIPAQIVPDSDELSIESNRTRHKTWSERIKEAKKIKEILTQKAKERQLAGKKVDPGNDSDKGRTMDHVGKIMGTSRMTADHLLELEGKRPDLLEKIDVGRLSPFGAYKTMKMEENSARHRDEKLVVSLKSDVTPAIRLGDFRILGQGIPDNSVSLILTDPPYLEEHLPLWDDLGALAARVLKPGGYLVTYSGHFHLLTCMNALAKHLDYYWLMSLKHAGQSKVVFQRNLIADFKPILVFGKPPLGRNYRCFHDLIEGNGPEKTFHQWGQDVRAFEELIEDFCPLDGHILEPFAGGGSVIEACLNTKRNVTAFEIETGAHKILERRFLQTPTGVSNPNDQIPA